MSRIMAELNEVEDAIKKAKKERDKLQARLEVNLSSLKESYGINSLEEAKELLESTMKKRDDILAVLKKSRDSIREKYKEVCGND